MPDPTPILDHANPWNQVPALVRHMPAPELLRKELRDRINAAYYDALTARGMVRIPQDTFAMHRALAAERDRFSGYLEAFKTAVTLLKQLQEEELVLAVGEQEGVPNQPMTIPDGEGDIRLSLDAPRVYDIDTQQLLAVLFTHIQTTAQRMRLENCDEDEILAVVFEGITSTLFTLGKFEPQVSKVRAWAASLARTGHDQDSAVVTGAITERHPYKGVRFERKKP